MIEEDRGDTVNTGEDDTQEGSGAGIIAGRAITTAGQYFLEVSEGFLTASTTTIRSRITKLPSQ